MIKVSIILCKKRRMKKKMRGGRKVKEAWLPQRVDEGREVNGKRELNKEFYM